jgi:hypothetical protein
MQFFASVSMQFFRKPPEGHGWLMGAVIVIQRRTLLPVTRHV